jgi:hypothetical protein
MKINISEWQHFLKKSKGEKQVSSADEHVWLVCFELLDAYLSELFLFTSSD